MRVFLEHTQYWLYRFLTNKNYRRFIWYSIFYGNKKRFVSRYFKFNGLKIFAPDTLSFLWQYKEIFADENYRFDTSSLSPIIYDCGSNIGTSCIYFAKHYPSAIIKAFEADPNVVCILNENISRNNIKNIEVFDKAVWINNEGLDLYLDGADGASMYSKGSTVRIPSVRLSELIEKESVIDFLKMDIEGAEYEVILDCLDSLHKIRNIFIEYHSFVKLPQKLSEILTILEKSNFRYFIKPVMDRDIPFINRKNKFNPNLDLQLNIYGYKIN